MMFSYCNIYLGEGILDIPDPAEEEEREIFFVSDPDHQDHVLVMKYRGFSKLGPLFGGSP